MVNGQGLVQEEMESLAKEPPEGGVDQSWEDLEGSYIDGSFNGKNNKGF